MDSCGCFRVWEVPDEERHKPIRGRLTAASLLPTSSSGTSHTLLIEQNEIRCREAAEVDKTAAGGTLPRQHLLKGFGHYCFPLRRLMGPRSSGRLGRSLIFLGFVTATFGDGSACRIAKRNGPKAASVIPPSLNRSRDGAEAEGGPHSGACGPSEGEVPYATHPHTWYVLFQRSRRARLRAREPLSRAA